jgi:hypothetical protein
MQQQIQHSRSTLDALRERAIHATAVFYRRASNGQPLRPPRFIVVPVSQSFFSVSDRITGDIKGWRQSHQAACQLADALARTMRA